MIKFAKKKDPAKSRQVELNKRQIVTIMVIFLALFGIYRTYTNIELQKELFSQKTNLLLSTLNEPEEIIKLDKNLSVEPFCGWSLEKNGVATGSANYESTSEYGTIVYREFNNVETGDAYRLAICNSFNDNANSSFYRQLVALLAFTAILYFLINTRVFEIDEKKI